MEIGSKNNAGQIVRHTVDSTKIHEKSGRAVKSDPCDIFETQSAINTHKIRQMRSRGFTAKGLVGSALMTAGTVGILASLVRPAAAMEHPPLAAIPGADPDQCGRDFLRLIGACGTAIVNAIVVGAGPASLPGVALLPLSTANCIAALRQTCWDLCIPPTSVWCN